MAISTTDYNKLQARIAKVLGTGINEFGYGQTVTSTQLDPIVPATISDFQKLRTDILAARYHQVGVPNTPPIPVVTSTNVVLAAFSSVLDLVEKNKLVKPHSTQSILDFPAIEEETPDTWNSTTTHNVTLQFTDADHMRYYFNSGGSIEFSAKSTTTSANLKSAAWNTLVTSIGVVSFKQNATTSTKSVGTNFGFSTISSDLLKPSIIFTKSVTDTPSPSFYTISANKDVENFLINFTITYTNTGSNVTSKLTSKITTFRATGSYVSVDAPVINSEFISGLSDPTFALSRSVAKINEGDKDSITGNDVGVAFTITTTNFADSLLYWSILGSRISASDFKPSSLTGSFDVTDNIGTFTIVAAADSLTEGVEQFNVQIRTDINPKSPIVAQLSSLEIIADLSTTPAAPTYTFLPLDATTVFEGSSVKFRIVTTNVPEGTVLNWSTKVISPTLTASDFVDNRLTGTITIYGNNAEFVRDIVSDPTTELQESFQIVLSYVNPISKVSRTVATSQTVSIKDAEVVAAPIPYTVNNDVYSVPEESATSVTFTINTPSLPLNTKLYWKVFTDVGILTASDFTDNALTGSVVISKSTGIVVKKAKRDTLTEGNEQFHLAFYSDLLMTQWLVDSEIITISETVPYVLTRSVSSIQEGSTAGAVGFGVTFTLTTPKLPDGTVLYWTTVSDAGTIVATDFTDNAIDGIIVIMNNTGQVLRRATSDNLVEGTEQFHLDIRATVGTSGPVLASSQVTSITETVKYEIIPQSASIFENQIGVEFVIKTPFLTDGTVLYWDTIVSSGSITATDFTDNRLTGTVTITNNTGSITRTAIQDNLTEGNESFYLTLKTGTATSTKVAQSIPVVISEVVAYTIVPSNTLFTEGQPGLTFNITTPVSANGTRVYWNTVRHSGNITENDFIVSDAQGGSAQRLSGYVTVRNNRASFVISGRPDGITEGDETFQIELRLQSITGPIQATTELITLSEIAPYQIVPNALSVSEGSSVSFNVTTPYLIDGTVLYWTTYQNSGSITSTDFTDALQGTVTIRSNAGTIIITAFADKTTEGVDAFSIQLRSGSYSGPILVTSTAVTIGDTSGTPPEIIPDAPTYAVVPTDLTVVEGASVTFNIFTTNVTPATPLFWTLFRGPGLSETSLVPSSSSTPIYITYNDPGSSDTSGFVASGVTITAATNINSQADRAFIFQLRTGSVAGTIVATSSVPVKVVDPTPYMVYANNNTIVEGSQTGVTFTVTAPAAANGTNLTWTVVSTTGTVDSYDLSPGITGQVAITSGRGEFTLTASANEPVEGNEKFTIALANASGSSIELGAGSPTITITENTPYLLTASTPSVAEGSPVTFTFSTPKLATDTTYTWKIVGKTGIIESSDFNPATLTGNITVPSSTSTQAFTVTPASDGFTEGNEQFYIEMTLTSTGQQITLGAPAPVIIIEDGASFGISADKYSITEGDGQITFTVNTPQITGPFPYPITVVTNDGITAADFYEKTMTPTLQGFSGTTGKFTLTPLDDKLAKGNRTFTVRINTPTTPYPETSVITIKDPVVTDKPPTPDTPSTAAWTLTGRYAGYSWNSAGEVGRESPPGTAVEGTILSTKLVTTTTSTIDRRIKWTVQFIKNHKGSQNYSHVFTIQAAVPTPGEPTPTQVPVTGSVILPAGQSSVIIDIPTVSTKHTRSLLGDLDERYYEFTLGLTCADVEEVVEDEVSVPITVTQKPLRVLNLVRYNINISPVVIPYEKVTPVTFVFTIPWYEPREVSYAPSDYSATVWPNAPSGKLTKTRTGSEFENYIVYLTIDVDGKKMRTDGSEYTLNITPQGVSYYLVWWNTYIAAPYESKMLENTGGGFLRPLCFTVSPPLVYTILAVYPGTSNNVTQVIKGYPVNFIVYTPVIDRVGNTNTTLYWRIVGTGASAASLGLTSLIGSSPIVGGSSATSYSTTILFTAASDINLPKFSFYLDIAYSSFENAATLPIKLTQPCPVVSIVDDQQVERLTVGILRSIGSNQLEENITDIIMPTASGRVIEPGTTQEKPLSRSIYVRAVDTGVVGLGASVKFSIVNATNPAILGAISGVTHQYTLTPDKIIASTSSVEFTSFDQPQSSMIFSTVTQSADMQLTANFSRLVAQTCQFQIKAESAGAVALSPVITFKVFGTTPALFNQSVVLTPGTTPMLTTSNASVAISGGDGNTSFVLSFAGPLPAMAGDSTVAGQSQYFYGNLINGSATVSLKGPWTYTGPVTVTASFTDKNSRKSNEITINSPELPVVTITVPGQTSLSVIANGSSVMVYCEIANLPKAATVTVQVVDASPTLIYYALELLFPLTGDAGTITTDAPSANTPTIRRATKTFTVKNQTGLTAGTFKVKFTVTDPNRGVIFATSPAISVIVPTVYTPTLTLASNIKGGLDILITGGRPKGYYEITLSSTTGSVGYQYAKITISSGELSSAGSVTIEYMVKTSLTGIFENLGNGTGIITAKFDPDIASITKKFAMITYRMSASGTVNPTNASLPAFPPNSYITLVAVGGGGGSGSGLDSENWSGSSAGGGGAGAGTRKTIFVTNASFAVTTFGTGGAGGFGSAVVVKPNTSNRVVGSGSGSNIVITGNGGNGGDTIISNNGSTVITARGGKGSESGYAVTNQTFTTPGGKGGVSDGAGSTTGADGKSGASDPKSGVSVCPGAAGGANSFTQYGWGANSSSVTEVAVQWYIYDGCKGGDGIASFTYFLFDYTSVTVSSDPIVIPPPELVAYTIGSSNQPFSVNLNAASKGTVYWEDLNITATSGMTMQVYFDDKGWLKIYDKNGIVTQTFTANANPGAITQTSGIISKIEAYYEDTGGAPYYVSAKLTNSSNVVIWTTRHTAKHFKK